MVHQLVAVVGWMPGIPYDCLGQLELDHVRASGAFGRKSRSTPDNLDADLLVPVTASGITREDNLRTACDECNLGKSARAVPAG